MTSAASSPTTTSSLAVRNGSITQQQTTALAIRAGQEEFNDRQRAALVAMGVSEKATRAELAVFFHQCQRTQLDPFQKQIYLIHRKAKDGDRWVDKPTTQIGIDGFRVIRDRIADRKGLRVEYEDTIWYSADGQALDVWLWDEPPAACKVTVTVDGRRFPSVLRFNEYCQRNKDGDRTGKWRDAFAHQIEKCCEADALRRAFPNDMSGLILDDAAPLDDPDAPQAAQRRASAQQIREARQPVPAEVIPEDVPPAEAAPPSADAAAPPQRPAGGTRKPPKASKGQVGMIRQHFENLGYTDSDRDARLRATGRLAGYDGQLQTTNDLTADEAARVLRQLQNISDAAALDALLNDGEVPGE
jgi:phage recombination protein Bet